MSTPGIGFLGLLTVALLVLKATGHLAISWTLVFAPLWVPAALVVLLVLAAFWLIEKRA